MRRRLTAFIWPEQPERLALLEQAIAIARAHPPRIDRADGAAWIADRLAEPREAGLCRVVFHSIALQYFPAESRGPGGAPAGPAGPPPPPPPPPARGR